MKSTDYNAIIHRLDKIDESVKSIRELVLLMMGNETDAGYYQEQIKKANAEKRDLEYQLHLEQKFQIK